jgi:hypothetical protein
LKFGLIADTHIGLGDYRLINHHAKDFLKDFSQKRLPEWGATFGVHLGDLIQEDNHDDDLRRLSMVKGICAASPIKMHTVAGSHDQLHVSDAELEEAIGPLYYSFDAEGFHFVVLFSKVTTSPMGDAVITDEQITWLKNDLISTHLPVVVLTHYSLGEQDLVDNFWFHGEPENCLVQNREAVRKIFEKHRVVAVFGGHLHRNQFVVHEDIPYITIQAVCEKHNAVEEEIPTDACALVEIEPGKMKIEVLGNDTWQFECTLRY